MRSAKYIRALTCFSLCTSLNATVFTVTTLSDSTSPTLGDGTFRSAVLQANDTTLNAPHQVVFSLGGALTLAAPFPPINSNIALINTNGHNITLATSTGASGIVINASSSLTIQNGTLNSGSFFCSGLASVGGNGSSGGAGGGGGALGAGAGLFVGQGSIITVQGMQFLNCTATGGAGAATTTGNNFIGGGGGGGMSGAPGGTGNTSTGSNGAGGGGGGGFGYLARGGTGGIFSGGGTFGSGGGGGGGINQHGGDVTVVAAGGGGGGSDAGPGFSPGGSGGNGANDFAGNLGGSGGSTGNLGTNAAANSSAGGGANGLGSTGEAGGNTTFLGGLGGFSNSGGAGGGSVGGGGGGGGGSSGAAGGNGGHGGYFGGGGGCGGLGAINSTGGAGGFGGGGGGGVQNGGAGGFGGGGGGGLSGSASVYGGGHGTTSSGGGGAALGGQIFVDAGAELTFLDAIPTFITGGNVSAGSGGSGTIQALGQDIFIRTSGLIVFSQSGTVTIPTSIASDQSSSTAGGLTMNGTGTLDISATANIYTGTTTIKGGGTIVAASDSNLGSTSPNLVPILLDNGTLEMSTAFNTSRSITVNSGGGTISVISSTSTINTPISGAGGLTKAGNGTLILSGANTYAGNTTVSGGILEFPTFGTYPNVAGIALTSSSAELLFTYSAGAGVIATDLSGVSGSSLNLGTLMLTFGTANSTTFAGNITSTGNVIKQNSGTVIFSGTNNYGSTTISSGTLQINSSSGIPSSNNIVDDSSLVFDYSGTLAISGQISGSGTLTMQGPGTLMLSATNTYNGPTTVTNGILQIESSGAFPSGSNLVVSGGTFDISAASSNITVGDLSGTGGAITLGSNTLIFGTSNSTSFGGNITGTTGGLTKQGGGTFTLGSTSSSSYSGTTLVSSGKLIVDGTIANSPISVASGATLGGTGTVAAVSLSGAIAPGNSIGTIHTGSFSFNPGSSYPLEFNNTSSDLIASTGTVTISNGSTLSLAPLALTSPKSSYTIITASSVDAVGTFTLLNPTPYAFSIKYSPTAVLLVLGGGGKVTTTYTATGNAGAAAVCFNALAASAPTSLAPIITILNLQTTSEWQGSFNEMQPANFNDIALAQENVAERIRQIYSSHLYDQRVSACDDSPHWRVWATPFAEWAHQDGHGSLSGYNENFAGFTVALDYMTRRHWAVSTGFSFAGSEVDIGSRSNSHFKTYAGSFATMWTDSRWFIDALFAYLYSPIRAKRKMSFSASTSGFSSTVNLTASHRQASNQVMAHLGWGYNILCYSPRKHRFYRNNHSSSKHRVNTFPFANLDYIYVMQNGYTETGADALDLSVRSKNYDLLRPEAGLGFNYIYCHEGLQCNLDLTASYVCEIRFAGQSTTANFAGQDCTFTVRGLKPFNNLFSPTARVTIGSSDKRVFFSLGYHGEYGANFSESAVEAELKRSF